MNIVSVILIILIILFFYTLLWFVINLILYFLSIIFKKPVILESFHTISMIFLWIFNTILGFGLLSFGISLLLNRQFIWLIVYIFIGVSMINWLFGILSSPFLFIQAFFAEKLEKFDFDENVSKAEILDSNKNVIGIVEGESTISRRLATYFILFYLINLSSLLIFPESNKKYQLSDFILTPFMQIIRGTILIGIPYIIFHKLKYKSFMPKDKRYLLISTWKIWTVTFCILITLALVIRLLFR